MVQDRAYLVSAKRPEMVLDFKKFMSSHMPESEWLYAADDLTDMPESFVCGELIREQLFRQLGEEIPYGCAVRMEKLEERDDIVVLRAQIVVNRKQHKGMIIGEKGSRIKEIGTESRMSLERHFRKKVFLELNVTIAEGWISDQKLLAELAHLQDLPTDIHIADS
jgi:GTP-binding protein Era